MALLRVPTVCAVLLLVSQLPRELSAQRSLGGGAEYGVKLCGREFIRAVIFTCGGSRWKRLSLEEEEDEGSELRRDVPQYRRRTDADFIQSSANKELNQLNSILGSQSKTAEFSYQQQPMKEYFNVYENYNDYAPIPDDYEYKRQRDEVRKTQSASDSNTAAESDGFPWIKYPRRRREISIGVAGICCKWGCTKAEISTLC
ncbi:relaxin-3-like [Bombina bombina]|uniref:relaxin-3-like n=1 Tax=Bombina bombina TaxID=8345 RepID=UPI00235AC1C0|nr:relaxin-3-like [Bombina bombina]